MNLDLIIGHFGEEKTKDLLKIYSKEKLFEKFHKNFLFYKPHQKQVELHRTRARFRLFSAGNRTGKTYSGAIEVAMHLTGYYPQWWCGVRFESPIVAWACTQTKELGREPMQKYYCGGDPVSLCPFKKIGFIHPSFIISKVFKGGVWDAIDQVLVKHKSGGVSRLYFKSYEQGVRSFQSAEVNVIHVDEDCPMEIFVEMGVRLTSFEGKTPGIALITQTPFEGITPLGRLFFFDDSGETIPELEIRNNRAYILASWRDTQHLKEEEILNLESFIPKEMRASREHGLPLVGVRLVYPVDLNKIKIKSIPNESFIRVCAVDFGRSKATNIIFLVEKSSKKVYIENIVLTSDLKVEDHSKSILSFVCDIVVFSSSIPEKNISSIISVYNSFGVRLRYIDPDLETGSMVTRHMLESGIINILDSLKILFVEIMQYSRGEDGKIDDHSNTMMNAFRIGCNYIYQSIVSCQVNSSKMFTR